MYSTLTLSMIDEDGREEWRGSAAELLELNEDSVDVALAVLALEEGAERIDVGGGAASLYTLVRVS